MEAVKLTKAQYHMFFGSQSLGRFRFFPKGRRLGATRGAAISFVKKMSEGKALLWGDTINSNIDRYLERYFKPFLSYHNIEHNWHSQKKLLKVGDGYTDFRSADKPENWEGFGYDEVFLNEAGIILNNEYLYINAVLPMMIDNPSSQLVAAGTPKLISGKGKFFYELCKKAINNEPGYYQKNFSTYDNPYLTIDQINSLEMKIPAHKRKQEIYGEFVHGGGSLVDLRWFKSYTSLPSSPPDKIIQSWDTASKDKQLNDPSVCTTWYIYGEENYLVDVFVKKLKYPKLKSALVSLANKFMPGKILIEDKSSGIALIDDLRSDIDFNFNIKPINPVADKVTRMSNASLLIEAGKVYLPVHSQWLQSYQDEIVEFPNGIHDDQVDSTSQFITFIKKPSTIFIG